MTRSRLKAGSIALAVTLAGPIFVVVGIAVDWLGPTGGSSSSAPGFANQVVPMLVLSSLFGSAIALLPCMIGATVMSMWGRGNEAMRMPVMWALAGGGTAGIPTALAADGPTAAILAATGAICALICRWRVAWWDEDSAIVPPRETAICVSHDT